MRRSALVFFVGLVVPSVACSAQWEGWDADFDEGKKSWREIQAQIPPYPKGENLVLVEAGSASLHRFYIDAHSVSLGEDGVTRYTVIVKTAGGATNVTFEGMRCETRERKLYALGRSDGSWVRARDPQWTRITFRELAPHHFALYRDYFCPERTLPTPPKQAVDALKRGVGLGRAAGIDD